jgi:ketosteroid isomerase-like protein
MYHGIVARRLRASFDALNRGDFEPVIAAFAPAHEHAFYGAHPLGGTRRQLDTTRAWYGRLARLLPDLRFHIEALTVSGMPWNTVAMVEWTDRFTLPDGSVGSNQGVHVLRLAWGRVIGLRVYCDTQKLAAYCKMAAEQGRMEGALPPLEDV